MASTLPKWEKLSTSAAEHATQHLKPYATEECSARMWGTSAGPLRVRRCKATKHRSQRACRPDTDTRCPGIARTHRGRPHTRADAHLRWCLVALEKTCESRVTSTSAGHMVFADDTLINRMREAQTLAAVPTRTTPTTQTATNKQRSPSARATRLGWSSWRACAEAAKTGEHQLQLCTPPWQWLCDLNRRTNCARLVRRPVHPVVSVVCQRVPFSAICCNV